MYTFGGVAATPLLILGQLINLSGGTIYTWEKYRFEFKHERLFQALYSEYNENASHRLQQQQRRQLKQ